MRTFYEVLGVKEGASAGEVKTAFHQCALRTHPDKGGDVKQFREVVEAFEKLSCPSSRAAYDTSLKKKDGYLSSTGSSSGDEGKRWRAKGGKETLYTQLNDHCRRLHSILVQLDQGQKAAIVKSMPVEAKSRFTVYMQRLRSSKTVRGPPVPPPPSEEEEDQEEFFSDSSSDSDDFRAERDWVSGVNGRRIPSDTEVRGIRKTFKMLDTALTVHYRAEVRIRNLTIRSQDTPSLKTALEWLDGFLEVRNRALASPGALESAICSLREELIESASPVFTVYIAIFDAKIPFARIANSPQKAFDAFNTLEKAKENQTSWSDFVATTLKASTPFSNPEGLGNSLTDVFARASSAGVGVEETLAKWRKRRLTREHRFGYASSIIQEMQQVAGAICNAEERRKNDRKKWQNLRVVSSDANSGARKRARENDLVLEQMKSAQKRMLSAAHVEVRQAMARAV